MWPFWRAGFPEQERSLALNEVRGCGLMGEGLSKQERANFFFWTHFQLRKFSNQSGQRSNSTRSHTPVGSSLAAAEIWHL